MASPIGHALVGVAAAGLAAELCDAPESAALWVGAVIASGVPDLDLLLAVTGRRGPAYHRNHSHSLFVLLGVAAVAWVVVAVGPIPLDAGLLVAWTSALLTHPLLDVVTSGPGMGERGYGIPLFWPLMKRRMHSRRDLFDRDTGDWSGVRGIGDLSRQVKPEVMLLGPPCAAIVLVVVLL